MLGLGACRRHMWGTFAACRPGRHAPYAGEGSSARGQARVMDTYQLLRVCVRKCACVHACVRGQIGPSM